MCFLKCPNLVSPLGHNKMRSSNCWKNTCIHENKKEITKNNNVVKNIWWQLSDNLTSFSQLSNKIVWHQSMKSVHFYNLAESVCWVNALMFSLTWKCQNNDMSKQLEGVNAPILFPIPGDKIAQWASDCFLGKLFSCFSDWCARQGRKPIWGDWQPRCHTHASFGCLSGIHQSWLCLTAVLLVYSDSC